MSGSPVRMDENELDAKCTSLENTWRSEIDLLQSWAKGCEDHGDFRMATAFTMTADAKASAIIVLQLFHLYALQLLTDKAKDEAARLKTLIDGKPRREMDSVRIALDEVMARQADMEAFYRKHAKGIRWAENLQNHAPATERKWWHWWK
jgi:hypothetical protein